ncbi:MAG: mechanosensitive ion channel family protein [Candidatus Gracilibacteria bacterium]|jgi:small-conductance mechanosensitive channel
MTKNTQNKLMKKTLKFSMLLFVLINALGIPAAFAQVGSTATSKDTGSSWNILAFVLQSLPLWITAIVIFVVSLGIGLMVKNIVESRLAAKVENEHQEVMIIAGRVAFVGVAVIGTTISLAIAGINITTLLAAVGFGISFGLQDTISNFVAGLAILASRPFTIGDWIKVNGTKGKVVEIRTRATYLTTYDGLRLIVPNAELYKSQVLSYTSNPMRRLKVPVYCRYGVSVQDVIKICLNEVKQDARIFLEPKANVVITDLDESYIVLEVRFWVDSKSLWRRIESKIFIGIQNKLEDAGFDAPYAVTSLSFEKDLESVALKSKAMDPNEFSQMINERMKEEEQLAKNREKLLQNEAVVQPTVTADQSGGAFLKTQNGSEDAAPAPTSN